MTSLMGNIWPLLIFLFIAVSSGKFIRFDETMQNEPNSNVEQERHSSAGGSKHIFQMFIGLSG